MNRKTFFSALAGGTLLANTAHASIAIDSMLQFAENGQTSFLVSNPVDYRQFLQVGISSLKVENGELVATPYSKDNIADWRLSAKPSRAILDPKMKKQVSVQFQAKNEIENDVDQAFQLSIVPTPYFAKGETPQHAVQIAIGFAPYVIVPAKKDQPLAYSIERNKDKLVLKNEGKTYINALIDACPLNTKSSEKKNCLKTVNALSGRNLSIDLPDEYQKAKNLKIRLSTHKGDYKDKFELVNGQKRKA